MAINTVGLLMLFFLTRLPNGYGQAPRRPDPSESSTAFITRFAQASPNTQIYPTSYYMETTDPGMFRYTLYLDYGSGNILYAYQLGQNADYGIRNYLLRDDLGTSFEYFEPYGYCGRPFPGLQFPARWTWLKETTYNGSEKFHNKDVDLWTYTFTDTASDTSTFHELGVSKQNPNIPLFYFMYTYPGSGFRISVYDKFRNGDPPESTFRVPTACHDGGLKDQQSESDQIPLRPKLAESFTAEITYVRSTFYVLEEPLKPGKHDNAKLYRHYKSKKQLQVNPLGRTTDAGSYYQLLRVDQNKKYNFFEPFGSCHITGLNSDMSGLDQPMWEWIKNARFSGVKQFRHQKINMWTYTDNTTSTFYSLGVSRRNPNMPIFLYESHTYYTYRRNVTVFEKYKPGPPHKSVFKIPKVCSEK